MKEYLKKEYILRLRMILKSELNAKNKITAFGALAILLLTKTSGKTCITWSLEKYKKN
jgi:hypothetical protein